MVIARQRLLPIVLPVEAAPEGMVGLAAMVATTHTHHLHHRTEAALATVEAGAGADQAGQ